MSEFWQGVAVGFVGSFVLGLVAATIIFYFSQSEREQRQLRKRIRTANKRKLKVDVRDWRQPGG